MADKLDNLKKFEKGESGNPAGRPKGAKGRATIARYWLEVNQNLKNPLTGESQTMSQEDLMTLALIKKARDGDVAAYKALMDSGYGAPKQDMDITTDGQTINTVPQIVFTSTNKKQPSKRTKK
jgi:hypothetical protein